MNELTALAITAGYQALAYFLIYPRAKSIGALRLLDIVVSFASLGTLAVLFWNASEPFSLVFFETNWFVFGLVAYIVLETPAWYFYMKAHPEQGTIAQLYGLASRPASKKQAKNVDQLMRDTKWNAIRTATAQKVLVVLGALALIASPVIFWFEDFVKPGIGILSVIPIFLIWWLLRISVRLVADAPDEYLDEFQIKQRDRTYLYSFRVLATMLSLLAVALMYFALITDARTAENVDYYDFSLSFGQVNAVIWLLLGSVILVPNMVLAWNQSKAVKP